MLIKRKLLEAQLHCLYMEGELDRSAYIHCLGLTENEQIERSIKVIVDRIEKEENDSRIIDEEK